MSKKGALDTKSLGNCLTKMMQENAEKIWLDGETKGASGNEGEKPKSDGKLGMIEDQLEDIVTDVKSNLTALFSRGEQFDDLQSKSENLREHVSRVPIHLSDPRLSIVVGYASQSQADQDSKREGKLMASTWAIRLSDNSVSSHVFRHMREMI